MPPTAREYRWPSPRILIYYKHLEEITRASLSVTKRDRRLFDTACRISLRGLNAVADFTTTLHAI
jgi:hypothetical protein